MGARCSVCCACAISYALERLGGQFCQGHWKHFSILGRYTCLTGSTGRVWVKQVLRVQAPRTQCGLLHGSPYCVPLSLSQSVAREGLLHLVSVDDTVAFTPRVALVAVASSPPSQLRPLWGPFSFPCTSPPAPDSQLPSLGSVTSVTGSSVCLGTWLIVCVLCVPFRYPWIRRWASQCQGFLLRGSGPPRALPKAHTHRRSTSRCLLLLPFQRQEGRTRGGMGLLWERRLSQKNTRGRQEGLISLSLSLPIRHLD